MVVKRSPGFPSLFFRPHSQVMRERSAHSERIAVDVSEPTLVGQSSEQHIGALQHGLLGLCPSRSNKVSPELCWFGIKTPGLRGCGLIKLLGLHYVERATEPALLSIQSDARAVVTPNASAVLRLAVVQLCALVSFSLALSFSMTSDLKPAAAGISSH